MFVRDLAPLDALAPRRMRRTAARAATATTAAAIPLLALTLASFETAFAFAFGRLLASVGAAP